MPNLQRLFVFLFLVMVAAASTFIVIRAASGEQVGTPVAICPGPDGYGYTCADEAAFAYVDATVDTLLYVDEGVVQLELPFTFTFYGAEYDQLWATSNGTLQFTTEDTSYLNSCLFPEPAEGMGDMIAPYWDDLTLAFAGYVETAVVGVAPERIFVAEWDDVPRFESPEDRLTFEVQLFEGSNDIVFLYQDAQTLEGSGGSQATIGVQSEQQGYALQVSCNQVAVFDGSQIHILYPETPVGAQAANGAQAASGEQVASAKGPSAPIDEPSKGAGGQLLEALNVRGRQGLVELQLAWLNQRPRLESEWLWADVDDDGRQELVILWRGDASRPELVELAIAGLGDDGRWLLRWQTWPLARQERQRALALEGSGDLTGDGRQEVVLSDPLGGGLVVLMSGAGGYELVEAPGRCSGPTVLRDDNADGVQEIVRGGCPGGERWPIHWDGEAFVVSGSR